MGVVTFLIGMAVGFVLGIAALLLQWLEVIERDKKSQSQASRTRDIMKEATNHVDQRLAELEKNRAALREFRLKQITTVADAIDNINQHIPPCGLHKNLAEHVISLRELAKEKVE